jgi:hypothetical protein
MPLISAEGMRQEGGKCEASMGYIMRLCLKKKKNLRIEGKYWLIKELYPEYIKNSYK